MAKKILVVEDEQDIANIIVFNLQRAGFETLEAEDGPTGLRMALAESPDLILRDVRLPGMDGFEICKRVRETSQVPIIMLTAREEEADKIFGLELGADDYVTKPFSNRELIARIRANMRRFSAGEQDAPQHADSRGLEISTEAATVYKDGKPVDLSVREVEILSYLAHEPGRVVSREELMEKVWGFEYYGDLRAVDVAIRRLREKIEDEPAQPKYIITKRGLGYYFAKS